LKFFLGNRFTDGGGVAGGLLAYFINLWLVDSSSAAWAKADAKNIAHDKAANFPPKQMRAPCVVVRERAECHFKQPLPTRLKVFVDGDTPHAPIKAPRSQVWEVALSTFVYPLEDHAKPACRLHKQTRGIIFLRLHVIFRRSPHIQIKHRSSSALVTHDVALPFKT
jgi:hypothetical protein